jgi:nucleoside 2-deoxyribosyltransferase
MRIYLAGPIFQCADNECISWREEAKAKLNGHVVVDPMERDYRGITDENYKQIVEDDKAAIDTCDVLLVNHHKPSVGTSMEILYAWERGKHIYTISDNGGVSPWMLYHCHGIFKSIDEAVLAVEGLQLK